ncbi:MAG: L-seryl-tRNA(Sec) selenium transferase [Acidimicrobiales bacterium]|nr:L-seryl-tRNA(Sec) selenium transferase [Acidimicrobiales bacterium]
MARSIQDVGIAYPLLVDAAREAVAVGDPGAARSIAEGVRTAMLRPVVNATGVLLHTNLGRAPLAVTTAGRPTNLEYDVATGRRGTRGAYASSLVARAAGGEDALVVNNCASAVLLVLAALASGRRVLVSRGELVEIGGGFRIPEIMGLSGADLVEVGTTNRTRLSDYEAVVDASVALVLKVHKSNYTIAGFTQDTAVADIAHLGVPVVADLGSGLLDEACPWLDGGPPAWLRGEPAARQTIEAGADLVLFSGDKLLGGPQAGIVAGRADLIAQCRRHPLYRASRPGGLVLGALQDVVMSYLDRSADRLPLWRMATSTVESLRHRAAAIIEEAGGTVADCNSVAGGGTLPGAAIPSAGVVLEGDHTRRLRDREMPVIARVAEDQTVIDLRTVEPEDDPLVVAAVAGS